MRNFVEWVLAEAEAVPGGKKDVISYLIKTWLPLVSMGNYFVHIPSDREDLQGNRSPINRAKDYHGKMYAAGKSIRRDVNSFTYREKGTEAIGLETFLKSGVGGGNFEFEDKVTAQLLTINQDAQVQCLDNKDKGSPFRWINERLNDYKRYVKSLKIDNDAHRELDDRMRQVEEEIQSWYKRGVGSKMPDKDLTQDDEQERLKRILWLINVEVPRIIGYASHQDGPRNYRLHYNANTAPFTDKFKGVRDVGVDILSHTCPMSTSKWVLIFNPKSIQVIDSVVVNGNFKGLKQIEGGAVVNPSSSTRQYDAMNQKIREVEDSLANLLDLLMGDEIYFSGSDKMLNRKNKIIKHLNYVKIPAITLAKQQPDTAKELSERFQHLLDQISQQIDQANTDADQLEDHPEELPQGMTVEEMKAEAQHWNDIKKAFNDVIKGIIKTK